MFLTILKKDLKRRKATNAILLVFIMLASMFFSSSVNNAAAVGEYGIFLSYASGDIVDGNFNEIRMHIEGGKILLN